MKPVTRESLANATDAQHRNVARVTPTSCDANITLGDSRTEPLVNICDFEKGKFMVSYARNK